MTQTDFKSRFTAYGGDYDDTMERFMNDEAFYLQMLAMLGSEQSLSRLEAAVSADDLTAAFEAAHELKGVAGNLGLKPLFNALCAVVEPLRIREKRDYAPLLRTIAEEFGKACALV